jgi:hypothetical protein
LWLTPRNLGVHGKTLLALTDLNGGNDVISVVPAKTENLPIELRHLPAWEYNLYWRGKCGCTPEYESHLMFPKLSGYKQDSWSVDPCLAERGEHFLRPEACLYPCNDRFARAPNSAFQIGLLAYAFSRA